jgi:hypothetical protein
LEQQIALAWERLGGGGSNNWAGRGVCFSEYFSFEKNVPAERFPMIFVLAFSF